MRYTGPKWKINRREGYSVLGSSEKWRRRPTLPGQFPTLKSRPTEYAIQFREKQKVKKMYGLNERQFRKFYTEALRSTGNSGLKLLQYLEMRLDNVVYKLGLASTRAQARQFVTHGHIRLNGKNHNIPSYIVKPNDEISLKSSLAGGITIAEITKMNSLVKTPAWLSRLDNGGKILSEPTRDEIDMGINERLIIELYSR